VDPVLLRLMEELLESMDRRDSGDPDAPAWEAAIRTRQLEDELARRLGAQPSGQTRSVVMPDGELVSIS
jgi:hypothetical protein